ncbi:GNAT family N-acetyltransferase [Acetivibrio straminisolvens]|jgi:ribosomal protein S18 acetylase RimI-like enzyme|nr:GNAT family N-acetyltransferase [Acetivibrio straminisolvens]
MRISIDYAEFADIEYLLKNDKYISEEMLEKKIKDKEIIAIRVDESIVGWLRYNYFWDNTPFMNMLYFDENHRQKGLGSKAVSFWEKAMKEKGYTRVMTSSLSNEQAQFFYRKLGYKDAGCLLLENEALEILFIKNI